MKKQFWLNDSEAEELRQKAEKACLTEAALLRLLIKGYEPRERPDERFFDTMKEMRRMGSNLNQLLIKAHKFGIADVTAIKRELEEWRAFQIKVEEKFLLPEKRKDKWQ
jgi:hypothetical protein